MKASFIILLTLISLAIASPFYDEFIDADGECWRCHTGYPCERCIRTNNDVTQLWNPYCPVPNCNDADLRHILFPSRDARFFFQCMFEENHWTVERFECQCDTLFNFGMQNCVSLHRWVPFCVEMIVPVMLNDCETGERRMIGSQSLYRPSEDESLSHYQPYDRRY